MHQVCEPSILYFGTPVVLISTQNENGSYNLAPMSSAFWLGWRCIIGLGLNSKTTENLMRTKECVLNLPSVNEVYAVNQLALTTGSNPVPSGKFRRGYRYVRDKFELAGMAPVMSDMVSTPRARECPVQMEAIVTSINPIGEDDDVIKGQIVSIELKIVRVHLEENILMQDHPNRIDPDKWRPLIMSFQQFYGLGQQVHSSALAQIPEHLYKAV